MYYKYNNGWTETDLPQMIYQCDKLLDSQRHQDILTKDNSLALKYKVNINLSLSCH